MIPLLLNMGHFPEVGEELRLFLNKMHTEREGWFFPEKAAIHPDSCGEQILTIYIHGKTGKMEDIMGIFPGCIEEVFISEKNLVEDNVSPSS